MGIKVYESRVAAYYDGPTAAGCSENPRYVRLLVTA